MKKNGNSGEWKTRRDFKDVASEWAPVVGGIASMALCFGVVAMHVTAPLWATNPDAARQTLINAKQEPDKVGGYGWFKCGGDIWATRFTLKPQEGKQPVRGTVCKGILKGSTIRYD